MSANRVLVAWRIFYDDASGHATAKEMVANHRAAGRLAKKFPRTIRAGSFRLSVLAVVVWRPSK